MDYRDYIYAGRVEIYYNNEWGTICDDFLHPPYANAEMNANNTATVICRQLGYSKVEDFRYWHGTQIPIEDTPYHVYSYDRPIWVRGLVCNGDESVIEQCSIHEMPASNCGIDENIWIKCSGYIGGRACSCNQCG